MHLMGMNEILLIVAFICFVLAAVGIAPLGVQLGWVGLALWVLTLVGLSQLVLLVLLIVLVIILLIVVLSRHMPRVVTRQP